MRNISDSLCSPDALHWIVESLCAVQRVTEYGSCTLHLHDCTWSAGSRACIVILSGVLGPAGLRHSAAVMQLLRESPQQREWRSLQARQYILHVSKGFACVSG